MANRGMFSQFGADVSAVLRSHTFYSSRPWPDGTQPSAPDWNPGCRCGKGMYFFEHDTHVVEELHNAGFLREGAFQ